MKPILTCITSLIIAATCTGALAQTPRPANTYFSVAVTENSHNHYGENLMYLAFSDTPQVAADNSRTVHSVRTEAQQIQLDGKLDEWPAQRFTRIRGRVMNNYPLGLHHDATPTEIQIASAFDDEYIYFALSYEDANRDASIRRNQWQYHEGGWRPLPHARPTPGTAASASVNRDAPLAGNEDEDRLLMMFPIQDKQKNFVDGGLGCAGYCHTNLRLTPDAGKGLTGEGVAAMHTALPGDLADLWHWTATRSRPMNTLKDAHLDYGTESYNGRKADDGDYPFENNALLQPLRPRYVSRSDYQAGRYQLPGFETRQLRADDLLEITPDMQFAEGVSLPFYIPTAPSGGIADVQVVALFDEASFRWQLELRRKRVTGDQHDRQFVAGEDLPAPTDRPVAAGDPGRGEKLFHEKACAACHGEQGEGLRHTEHTHADGGAAESGEGGWHAPRNQRASAPAIRKTVSPLRPRRLQYLAHSLQQQDGQPPEDLMPFVTLTPQEIEDIASWLQLQYTPDRH
ncbi:ethylbenzene dehydrogenase-related protein [Sedimenticola hydrogenitrophicus]|uniref:ethylbenzene dehydrogenase-related protein n=1 Tax=Sedimenticola hydrogenitrophicus TaxID=2967975 RepID=UPI0023AFE400|nr:ethylbenzene dehydrogenase-related protein [Sedimenticola hydrogenitrophicus]